MARYLSFLICCLALLPQLLFSQQSADVVTSVSQERIYLQTDKPYYAAGDTVCPYIIPYLLFFFINSFCYFSDYL